MKYIIVLGAQVPFVRGGAELLNESLVREINKIDGYTAELVQLPYKWYPEEQMLKDIMAWRLLDLSESNGIKVDLVIGTKFPTYAVKHEKKVLWLVHQHRTLYDLEGSKYDGLIHAENSKQVRDKLRTLDSKLLKESYKKYTIADNVTNRLMNYNNIKAETLFPPAPFAEKIVTGKYGDYILYLGRMEVLKRPSLLIEALKKADKKTKVIFIGRGPEIKNIQILVDKYDLSERCSILGYVSEEILVEYLANARAVFYGPLDEDYGYATIEAFLAKKPVVTCDDSGEVRNIVKKTGSGFVCKTSSHDISVAMNKLYNMSDQELFNMSEKGYHFAKSITWENVINKLVLENLC